MKWLRCRKKLTSEPRYRSQGLSHKYPLKWHSITFTIHKWQITTSIFWIVGKFQLSQRLSSGIACFLILYTNLFLKQFSYLSKDKWVQCKPSVHSRTSCISIFAELTSHIFFFSCLCINKNFSTCTVVMINLGHS